MLETAKTTTNENAMSWLRQVSLAFTYDDDIIDVMSAEDVVRELQNEGADVEGFHAKLRTTLSKAQFTQAFGSLIRWISPVWHPQWAGQPVSAGDIARQKHRFPIAEGGNIEVTCSWKPESPEGASAYLDIAWHADTVLDGEFWCRFVEPGTDTVLAEISLGAYREGGKYVTRDVLGFDPSTEPWAISILLKHQRV